MRTIAEEWAGQEQILVPLGAHQAQQEQTKLAFYAGAQSMLRLLLRTGDDDVSMDAGANMLQFWSDECDLFAREWAKSKGVPDEVVDAVVNGFKGPRSCS